MTESTGGPGADRRRRDAEATRQELLQAAHGRFQRLGYDRTTLRDVAADVGVNLALIKRYFGSKEGLFKAALASAPRSLGGDSGFPRDLDGLAEALSRQLSDHSWPEAGEHPVLMLLRVSGDERVDGLRRQALLDFSRQILGVSENQDLLRAELLVALGVGISVVRSAVGLQPLLDATAEELTGPLREIIGALLGDAGTGKPGPTGSAAATAATAAPREDTAARRAPRKERAEKTAPREHSAP